MGHYCYHVVPNYEMIKVKIIKLGVVAYFGNNSKCWKRLRFEVIFNRDDLLSGLSILYYTLRNSINGTKKTWTLDVRLNQRKIERKRKQMENV